jgi:nitroreductase
MSTTPLTVPEAIRQRRSVKSFAPTPIPAEILHQVIELTLAAPSSFNLQQWRIVLIDDPKQKEALAAVSWGQKQLIQAPVTLVFAVSIAGWEKTFEHTLAEASRLEAWPEKVASYFRDAVPGFQKGLGALAREYAIKDALIAATHAALAAESLGLGSSFMNGWSEAGVKQVIGVENDPDIAIALLLPIGYPADVPKFSGRLDRKHTVFQNRLA